MKKFTAVMLAIICLFALSVTALATDEAATAMELYQQWGGGAGYPDYVCGVWVSEDDQNVLVFAVTKDEAGEAGKQEILDAVADDSTVQFTYASHTYRELYAIYEEFNNTLPQRDVGANGWGIDESENCVTVYVDPENSDAEFFIKECVGKYGDAVQFKYSDGFAVDTTAVGINDSFDRGKGSAAPYILAAVFAALLLIAAGVVLRGRLEKVFAYVEAAPSEEYERVERTVRASASAPEELDKRVMDAISKAPFTR